MITTLRSLGVFLIIPLILTGCQQAPSSPTSVSSTASSVSSGHPMIEVYGPPAGAQIISPLTVTGRARGPWYFEASFPVKLLDGNGNQIAVGIAEAQGDWMTTDFVPFQATITFTVPATPTGTLVLEKQNASGEPQNADSISIPVQF